MKKEMFDKLCAIMMTGLILSFLLGISAGTSYTEKVCIEAMTELGETCVEGIQDVGASCITHMGELSIACADKLDTCGYDTTEMRNVANKILVDYNETRGD